MMRPRLLLLGLGLGLVEGAPARKNVMYVVVDDLRGEMGFTSKTKGLVTPNIDGLAANGTVFTRCYVQQTVCSPSRNSFLSGRRPDTTRVWNFLGSFRDSLGDSVTSMPGAFKNAGYVAVGQGKVYHIGGQSPWGTPRHTEPPLDDGTLSYNNIEYPYFHAIGFQRQISDAPDSEFQDGMITDQALKRMKPLAAGSKPFFLAVGLHKPHVPWVMPQRFLDMQLPQAETDVALHDTPPQGYVNASLFRCCSEVGAYVGPSGPMLDNPLNRSLQQENRRLYRAAVTWTDFNLGRLLAGLEANNVAGSTAIMFHGDHGWNLGDHGGWCKQSLFETVAHIPLVVYVPWLPQSHGQRVSALVEAVDFMPSLIDLAGIAHTVPDWKQLEGDSFVPLLLNPSVPAASWKPAVFTQYPRCNGTSAPCRATSGPLTPMEFPTNNACTFDNATDFEVMGYSIRTDSYRYTRWMRWHGTPAPEPRSLDGGSPGWDEVVGEELYSHAGDDGDETNVDRFEHVNLATDAAHAAEKARLVQMLKAGWKAARPKGAR